MNFLQKTVRETVRPFRQFGGALRALHRFIFSRPRLQKLNDRLLNTALNARGYNNNPDIAKSGEAYFPQQLAKEHPVFCIDVGANKGEYSRHLLGNTQANVLCFEPQSAIFQKLTALVEAYPGRFYPVSMGVGDKTGWLDPHYGEQCSEVASLAPKINRIKSVGAVNQKTISVAVTTLDEFFATQKIFQEPSRVDLLKIDTEGFEQNVLRGAMVTIGRLKPKYIQVEISMQHLHTKTLLLEIAGQLGVYQALQITLHGLAPVDPADPLSNISCFSNFVFVRNVQAEPRLACSS
jgi:FkbM family methyltransferase